MVTCPAADTLRQLLDETLPDPDRAGLRGHLTDCPACQARLDDRTDTPDLPRPATQPIAAAGLAGLLDRLGFPAEGNRR